MKREKKGFNIKSISLTDEALEYAKKMSEKENRSFSNYVSTAIMNQKERDSNVGR